MAITYSTTHGSLANPASAATSVTATITTTSLVLIFIVFETDNASTVDAATPITNTGTGMSWTKLASSSDASSGTKAPVRCYAAYGNQNASVTFTHSKANSTQQYRKMSVVVIEGADTTLSNAIPVRTIQSTNTANVSQTFVPGTTGAAIFGVAGDFNAVNAYSALSSNTATVSHQASTVSTAFIEPTTNPLTASTGFVWGANCTGGANTWVQVEVIPADATTAHMTASTAIVTDTGTYTFSSTSLGLGAANRAIAVIVYARDSGATATLSSVTCGGNSMSSVVAGRAAGTNVNFASIYIIDAGTGSALDGTTSASIVVTFSESILRCAIDVIRLTNISGTTAYDTDSVTATSGSSQTRSPDVPANGICLAGWSFVSSSGSTVAWTNIAEISDRNYESNTIASGAMQHFASAQTPLAITATRSGGTLTEQALVVASWSPPSTGSVGASAGTGAAAGVGAQIAAAAGSSAGTGAASGASAATAAATGASAGTATVTATSIVTAAAAGASAGVGTATATGVQVTEAAGSSAGVGVATATGAQIAAATGSSAGVGTATGVAAPPSPTHVSSVSDTTQNGTTSMTLTVPSVNVDDLIVVYGINRDSVTTPTVTDDDTGGNTYTRKTTENNRVNIWYKRATSGTSAKTITISGTTGSVAGGLSVYRNTPTSGDPFGSYVRESNSSGDESQAGLTPSEDNCMVIFVVGNRNDDNVVSSVSGASTGAFTQRVDSRSTGGSDCAIYVADQAQTTATATGTITWSQVDGGTDSLIISLRPNTGASTVTGDGLAAGTGAATAVGAQIAAATGTSAGTATVTGVSEAAGSVGAAAGTGTATGVGASIAAAAGSSAGLGAATATGIQTAAAAGAAAGTGTATATGAKIAAAAGSSAGVGAATGVSEAGAAIGSAAGTGTATAVGAQIAAATGSSTATSTVTATGAATKAAAGASAGIGVASATSTATAASTGTSAGTGAATAVGAQIAAAVGNAAATGAAAAVSNATGTVTGVGSSAGVATVTATSAVIAAAVGSSAGTSTVAAVGTGVRDGVGSSAAVGAAAALGAQVASVMGIAAGTAAAAAIGRWTAAALGLSTGTGAAAAVSEYVATVSAVGLASGQGTALGVGVDAGAILVPAYPDQSYTLLAENRAVMLSAEDRYHLAKVEDRESPA